MKRIRDWFFAVLLLCAFSAGALAEFVVGTEIAKEDLTGSFDTLDAPPVISGYRRCRVFAEDGTKRLCRELRRGGPRPLTKNGTAASGTVELSDEAWTAFYDGLRGGTVDSGRDGVMDGGEGPRMILHRAGDAGEGRAIKFASPERQNEFAEPCARLARNHVLTRFRFSRGGYMMPWSCEITLRNGRYDIRKNEGDPRPFDPELASELQRVIAEYGLEAWDGFHESDSNVLDGENFSLVLTYADGTSVYASGDNAFPERYFEATGSIDAILEKEERAHIAGTYRYEGEGFGGDFTLTLNADGTYTFYEGPLSSYMGGGSWNVYDDAVYMTEESGYDLEFMFGVEDDALIYIEMGSDAFPYVKVSDAERFVRQDEAEEP